EPEVVAQRVDRERGPLHPRAVRRGAAEIALRELRRADHLVVYAQQLALLRGLFGEMPEGAPGMRHFQLGLARDLRVDAVAFDDVADELDAFDLRAVEAPRFREPVTTEHARQRQRRGPDG